MLTYHETYEAAKQVHEELGGYLMFCDIPEYGSYLVTSLNPTEVRLFDTFAEAFTFGEQMSASDYDETLIGDIQ